MKDFNIIIIVLIIFMVVALIFSINNNNNSINTFVPNINNELYNKHTSDSNPSDISLQNTYSTVTNPPDTRYVHCQPKEIYLDTLNPYHRQKYYYSDRDTIRPYKYSKIHNDTSHIDNSAPSNNLNTDVPNHVFRNLEPLKHEHTSTLPIVDYTSTPSHTLSSDPMIINHMSSNVKPFDHEYVYYGSAKDYTGNILHDQHELLDNDL